MTDPDNGTPGSDGQRPEPESSQAPSLPPPAFPPGSRRHRLRRRDRENHQGDLGGAFISPDEPLPERDAMSEAFISPDEPIPHRDPDPRGGGGGAPEEAFISPDEPIPHRDPHSPAVTTRMEEEEDAQVVVTGMGDDAHLDPDEMAAAGDPYVMELTEKVAKLAQALRQKGEAGLRAHPDMDRFESTLRGYCVGYLAGRRAQDEG